jgi:hypothetical protein
MVLDFSNFAALWNLELAMGIQPFQTSEITLLALPNLRCFKNGSD